MTPDEPQTRMTPLTDRDLEAFRAVAHDNRNEPARFGMPTWGIIERLSTELLELRRTRSVEPPREMVERARAIYEDFKPVVLPRSNGNVWEEDYHAAIIKRWAAEFTSVRSQAIELCAGVADGYSDIMAGREIAASIRSLRN